MRNGILILLFLAPFALSGMSGLGFNSYSLLLPENGFFNNPAGLNALARSGICMLFSGDGPDFYSFRAAYGRRIKRMVLAAGADYRTSDPLDILNEQGENEGSFRYQYVRAGLMAASSSYFLSRVPDIHYGIRIRFESEKADAYSGTAANADIGLLYNLELYKVRYLDRIGMFFSLENLGQSLSGPDRSRMLTGLLLYLPLVKDLSQVLMGAGYLGYFSGRLEDNSGPAFSLGFRQALSLVSSALKGAEFTAGLSYTATRAGRIMGDETGLEYGFSAQNSRLFFNCQCRLNSLAGNSYSALLGARF